MICGPYSITWDGSRNWIVEKQVETTKGRNKGGVSTRFIGYYGTLERACVAVLLDRQGDYGVKDVRALKESLSQGCRELEQTIRKWAVPAIPFERLAEEMPE